MVDAKVWQQLQTTDKATQIDKLHVNNPEVLAAIG